MNIFIHKNIVVIKKGSIYFATGGICPENYDKLTLSDLTPEDIENISCFNSGYEEAEVSFSITASGIELHNFHDLFQFNCCSSNEELVEAVLKVYALETNQPVIDLASLINEPNKYKSKCINNVEIFFEHQNYNHILKFDFKGLVINGTNQLCKYSFFTPANNQYIWELITSVEELVDYYITVNKILASACFQSKDDMYLSCDSWAKANASTFVNGSF
jgi:hypothetical protein